MTERLAVGPRDVTVTKSSHTRGVRQGNAIGNYERMEGHNPDGTSTARRSTGIDPQARNPITPGAPNLSPP